jgi:transposase
MTELSNKLVVSKAKYFCGIDFHKNTSTYCVLDEQGQVFERPTTIRTSRLVSFFSNRKDYHIGIESTGGANDIVEKLKQTGHRVTLIDTVKFKGIGIGGKKTDEKDARAIADILRLNYLPEVFHKSIHARRIKSLLVHREHLVHCRINSTNHIRGLLREYGITMPVGVSEFWQYASLRIEELEDPILRNDLSWLFESTKKLNLQINAIDDQIKNLGEEDDRVIKLKTIPGFGPITSLLMLAIVDDINRFSDAKKFGSYIGLTPREFSSGDKRRLGSITRSGPEMLRRNLIHGARAVLLHTTEKTSDPNRQWAYRLKNKVGMNKATVALAHRLARIAFAILRDQNIYKYPKVEINLKQAS